MDKIQITLLPILLIVVGFILLVVSLIIPMPSIYIFVVSFGGGVLIGIGSINLYLDWRLRRKWNKRFIPYRKKGE